MTWKQSDNSRIHCTCQRRHFAQRYVLLGELKFKEIDDDNPKGRLKFPPLPLEGALSHAGSSAGKKALSVYPETEHVQITLKLCCNKK